jgi:hypothetical protein
MPIVFTEYQHRIVANMNKRLAHAAPEQRSEIVEQFAEDLIAAERKSLSRQLDALNGLSDRELIAELDKLTRSYRRGVL